MHTANIWEKSEQGFLSESRNKMRRRRADSANDSGRRLNNNRVNSFTYFLTILFIGNLNLTIINGPT